MNCCVNSHFARFNFFRSKMIPISRSGRFHKKFHFGRNLQNSTISENEIGKFSKMSTDWWNPEGDLRTLHQINPVRVRYVHIEYKLMINY